MPLEIKSLGFRSDVELTSHLGEVETKSSYTVVRSPNNPTFYWGNFILFDEAPSAGVFEKWTQAFDNEFGTDSGHVAIGWNQDAPGETQAFIENGFSILDDTTLTLDQFRPRTDCKLPVEIRPLASDSDWQATIELQILCSDEPQKDQSYRVFRIRQFRNYRKLQELGHGHWWGAFLAGKLVADMGLFFDASRTLARFQSVETRPNFRNKGLCSHLLSHVLKTTLETEKPKQIVICTDEDSPARRIYEQIGFKFHSRFYGLTKTRTKQASPSLPIVFKPSLPSESQQLSDIAIAAKGHWGYSQELLDLWRDDLRFEASYITENHVRSIWCGNQIIGFFAIVTGTPDMLDHLWILPAFIGKGYGKQALDEIRKLSRQLSIPELTIISDPDAEGFYLHHGAVRIGEHPSKPQNRMLPKLRFTIN